MIIREWLHLWLCVTTYIIWSVATKQGIKLHQKLMQSLCKYGTEVSISPEGLHEMGTAGMLVVGDIFSAV